MQSLMVSRDSNGFLVEFLPLRFKSFDVLLPIVVFSLFGVFGFGVAVISSTVGVFGAASFSIICDVIGLITGYSIWRANREYVQIRTSPERLQISVMGSKTTQSWEWEEPDLVAITVFAESDEDPPGLRIDWRQEGEIKQITILKGRDGNKLRRIARIIGSTMKKPISVSFMGHIDESLRPLLAA